MTMLPQTNNICYTHVPTRVRTFVRTYVRSVYTYICNHASTVQKCIYLHTCNFVKSCIYITVCAKVCVYIVTERITCMQTVVNMNEFNATYQASRCVLYT